MRYRSAIIVFLLAVACGSGSGGSNVSNKRPENIARPDISVDLASSIFWGSQESVPTTVDVTVTNRADQPISVRRVEVSSVNMTQYRLRTGVRDFRDTIAPGETKVLPVTTTADRFVTRPSEPLNLRAVLEIEAAGARWREIVSVHSNRPPPI